MQEFQDCFKGQFNYSQRNVLARVSQMIENEILLIQGPVSLSPSQRRF